MNRFILVAVIAMFTLATATAFALDNTALVGKWELVENARDTKGNPCPFITPQLEFTADGKMISAKMPAPFRYKVNPGKIEAEKAVARFPDLEGMDIMLALVGNTQNDWSKAPIVYGIQIKDNQLAMKVSGYTPARYQRKK